MTTPTEYLVQYHNQAGTIARFTEDNKVARFLLDCPNTRSTMDLVLRYAAGPSERVSAEGWLFQWQTDMLPANDDEAEERALLAEKQKRLAEALKKYHAGYDNELYIRACYSLPARTQGEWSFVNACVSLSDAALSVCGGQQYGSLTFDELTPEVIRFLAAFVLPQDEALELPF